MAAPVFDVANNSGGYLTTTSFNITVGAGANRYAVILLGHNGGPGNTLVSASFDGSALTDLIGTQNTSGGSYTWLYGVKNPASGSRVVSVTFTADEWSVLGCACYSGVDQTTPFTNYVATDREGVLTPTVTVSGDAADLGVAYCHSANSSSISDAQTNRWTQTQANASSAGSEMTGAASMAFSWTLFDSSKDSYPMGFSLMHVSGGTTVAQYENAIQAALASGGIVGVNHLRT